MKTRNLVASILLALPACAVATGPDGAPSDDSKESVASTSSALVTVTQVSFESLGGDVPSSPGGAFLQNTAYLDVYVSGDDSRLYQKYLRPAPYYWTPSSSGWNPLDTSFALGSSPMVLSATPQTRSIYARGAVDGALYLKSWDQSSGWTGWAYMGGQFQGRPAAGNPSSNTVDIYIRGMDNHVWQKYYDGASWYPSFTGFVPHTDGFVLASEPAVLVGGASRVLYAQGPGGAVYSKWWSTSTGQWSAWTSLGGQIKGAPAVTQTDHAAFVFVRGMDDHIWYGYEDLTNGVWSGFKQTDVTTSSSPTATAWGNTASVFFEQNGMPYRLTYVESIPGSGSAPDCSPDNAHEGNTCCHGKCNGYLKCDGTNVCRSQLGGGSTPPTVTPSGCGVYAGSSCCTYTMIAAAPFCNNGLTCLGTTCH